MSGRGEQWDIKCQDCGKFILTEKKEYVGGNIVCIAGSYDDGFYDGEADVFYCKACAKKRGFDIESE